METGTDEIVRAIDNAVAQIPPGATRTLWSGHPNEQARRALKALDEALRERGTPVAPDVLRVAARAAASKALAAALPFRLSLQ